MPQCAHAQARHMAVCLCVCAMRISATASNQALKFAMQVDIVIL